MAGGANAGQMSAQGMQDAGAMTMASGMYQPMSVMKSNIGNYMNPYVSNVVDNTVDTMNRGRQMAMQDIGDRAISSGAFGGARHGVAEAETNRNFFETVGNVADQGFANAFNNATNLAQYDINNQIGQNQTQLGAASQLGSLSDLGFNQNQVVQDNLAKQGALQQSINQLLLDTGQGMYQNETDLMNRLTPILTSLGVIQQGDADIAKKKVGLFDVLTMLATAGS